MPYRFCPHCRAALTTRRIPSPEGPERRVCAVCGFVHWNNSKPTAGAVIEQAEGRVLLVRRAVEPARGDWDVPGGFLEPGEHPEAGLRREIGEETGLEIEIVRLLGIYMDRYGEYTTLNLHYLCRVTGGHLAAADDASEASWFAPAQLPQNLSFDNVRAVLQDWRRLREGNKDADRQFPR